MVGRMRMVGRMMVVTRRRRRVGMGQFRQDRVGVVIDRDDNVRVHPVVVRRVAVVVVVVAAAVVGLCRGRCTRRPKGELVPHGAGRFFHRLDDPVKVILGLRCCCCCCCCCGCCCCTAAAVAVAALRLLLLLPSYYSCPC
jgi:hypothetical protein